VAHNGAAIPDHTIGVEAATREVTAAGAEASPEEVAEDSGVVVAGAEGS